MSELREKIAELTDLKLEYNHCGIREDGFDRWDVTIFYQGKSFNTKYDTGPAYRKFKHGVTSKMSGGYYFNGQSKSAKEAMKAGWLQLGKPDLTDLMHSLLSDSSMANETFVDWCSMLGYDTDSRKAIDIYLACQNTRVNLIKMFGYQLFEELSQLEH